MEFFHIYHTSEYTENPEVEKDMIINTNSRDFNPYYKNILNGAKVFDMMGIMPPLQILDLFRSVQRGDLDDIPGLNDYKVIAKTSESFLSQYINFFRETIFEQVRVGSYMEQPSRLKCIWLAENFEDAKYWLRRLEGRSNPIILKVEAKNDKFHSTNEGHLSEDSATYEDTLSKAMGYWSGEESTGHTEILYEGELVVKELC